MAASINRVALVGNLTRDPELRHTPSGTAVCSLRLAVNTRRKDESGQWTDKPNYFDVTVWGQQGENCAQYLSKGRPVAIDGRLEWREWEAKDGSGKRQSVEIIADTVQFLGGGQEGGGQPALPFVPLHRRNHRRPPLAAMSRRARRWLMRRYFSRCGTVPAASSAFIQSRYPVPNSLGDVGEAGEVIGRSLPIVGRDELRAVLRIGDSIWGFVDLYRESATQPFAAADVALLDGRVERVGVGVEDPGLGGHRTYVRIEGVGASR